MEDNFLKPFFMISAIIPVYNEEKYISDCLDSLLQQDYLRSDIEYIFVDGISKDRTKAIILDYKNKYGDLFRIIDNPNKTVPYAMNLGIKASKGRYVIRLDAHAEYPPDYITNCVRCLDKIDADNVGGLAITKGKTKKGKIIAKMLSSKFGVGNSRFRTNGKSGYVDTVPFGAFRREVFSNYGGYDLRLDRNQDNEMNYRIRKNGGKVYLSSDIIFTYYCRDNLKGILKMAFTNGKWNVITMKLCPKSMGLRHFVPFGFVLSIMLLSIFGFLWWPIWVILASELILYSFLNIVFSARCSGKISEFLTLLYLFFLFHISYGCGSFIGIILLFSRKFNKKYKNEMI